MAARADELGYVGQNAPQHWKKPLGSKDIHLVVVGLAPNSTLLEASIRHARNAVRVLSGIEPI